MSHTFEKLPGGSHIPNIEGVLALLRRYGLHGLSGHDGCRCAHFSILGISVDVSCHKSEHMIRVHAGYLGFDQNQVMPIVREIQNQFGEDVAEGYGVRLCDWRFDNKNGRREDGEWVTDVICVYCERPREDRDGYLCNSCRENPNVSGRWPDSK